MTTFRSTEALLPSGQFDDAKNREFRTAATLSGPGELADLWSGKWLAFVWSSVPAAIVVAMAASRVISEQAALSLMAVSFVGLNLMHMGATWARVYVRPAWRVNPFERLTVPLLLAAFAVSFESIGGGALLLALQYFLSFHHALMQNFGLVRASQRRDGRAIDPRLDLAACLLLPGAALLHRADMVCNRYSGALLPGIPSLLIQAMTIAGVIALFAFGWREWRSYRRGERIDPIGIGILLGTNVLWSALLVGDSHPALPLYALASGHYAQYLYFVWHVEARESVDTAPPGMSGRLLSVMRASPMQYLAVLLAMAGAATFLLTIASFGLREAAASAGLRPSDALDIPPWAAAMIGINFEHYWLDRRIWRTRPRRGAMP